MELRDYLRVLAKHWISIVVITAVVTGAVAVWTFLQPKVYTAQAQTFVAIAGSGADADPFTGATYTLQRIQSYINIIDSPDVLQPVIEELGLEVSVKDLSEEVSATNPIDTVLINVSASNVDPARAAAIANAVSIQLGTVIQQLETTAAGNAVPVKATLTDPADPPESPSSPRTRVNLLLGLIIGLALGVGYAFLKESLDTSVKGPDELADLTGATPLGLIAFDPNAKDNPIVALDQRSTRAEAFRTIRTNLQYVDVDNPPQVVAITSAVPGEGKSTTAVNLAIAMAQAGKKVVLVETDLRKPKASSYLGVESGLGLTDVLAGNATLPDALLPWNRGLLTVLPAGAGLIAAPSASAYPAGSSPGLGIVGANRVAPRSVVRLAGFNFKPGCAVVLTVQRQSTTRTSTAASDGKVAFRFRAPRLRGNYRLTATQKQTANCPLESASNRLRVR